MTPTGRKEIVLRFYEEVINKADYGQLNSIFSENVVLA